MSLFGCSGQTNKNDSKQTNVANDDFPKSMQDFKNRPIHKKLTEQIVDTTSDDNLLQVVFDNLSEKEQHNLLPDKNQPK